MAKPEWGSKHTCPSCGAKFYDLKRNPIICPSCEQEVVVQPVLKSRRQAPAEVKAPAPAKEAPKAKPKDDDSDDDDDAIEEGEDLVLDGDDDEDDDDSLIEDTSDLDDDADVAVVAEKDDDSES